MIRQDKFKKGDEVYFTDEAMSGIFISPKQIGKGPHVVEKVTEAQNNDFISYGHTQHITLKGRGFVYSGWYFNPVR